MPENVADDIHKYGRERALDATDPWVDASLPTVRRWVKYATVEIFGTSSSLASD